MFKDKGCFIKFSIWALPALCSLPSFQSCCSLSSSGKLGGLIILVSTSFEETYAYRFHLHSVIGTIYF
jgi:hypothetical protein